ncbi:MAG: GIY-YIG nuclease family protein [Opitutaceae bacterium]
MHPLFSQALRLTPTLSRGTPVVYLLRLQSGGLYIGSALDLVQRLNDHATGRAGRTTALDPPAALLRVELCSSFAQARQRETQLKHWTRAKQEALIAGNLASLFALSESRD